VNGPAGPTVRVMRGKSVSVEAVGRGTSALTSAQRQGLNNAADTVPAAMSTLQ
jgi:pilus assembly protein CpaB